MVAEMIYCFREAYINVAYAAGHIKETAKFAYIEALINIVVSLILVHRFELLGVAIGFLAAGLFRLIAQVIYIKKHILYRPIKKFAKSFLSLFITSAAVIVLSFLVLPLKTISGYFEWALNAVIAFVICLVALLGISLIIFKNELKKIVRRKKVK